MNLELVYVLCGKTKKLMKLFIGGAGWFEPLLKWVETNLVKKLKRTKQREVCHIWEAEKSLLEQEILTEAPTKTFKCIPKALGKH